MEPNPRFWSHQRVCVTGGTGFLGWHLVRQLLPLTAHVRVLGLRPRSAHLLAHLEKLDCLFADIRDPLAVRQAVRDCQVVFHTAGPVAVWGPSLAQMRAIHLEGTRHIIEALPAQARLVHTSSAVTIGAARTPEVLTEASPFQLQQLRVDYVHAKKGAEDLALTAARHGKDVVVVNPAYLVGPQDYEGSIMGRFCLRCWRGRVPLIPPGGLNFVDVRDVARGHLLAAESGKSGQRYLLGGENLTMRDFVQHLAQVRGLSARWWFRMPGWMQWLLACGAELRACLLKREPYPSMQHVRLSRYHWYYSSRRAQIELGYQPRPLGAALIDAHEWYCATGQLKPTLTAMRPLETEWRDREAA